MNLTGRLEGIDDQLAEAVQLVVLARRMGLEGRWLDVGSGGGFPGLVLAACLDVELTLVEPRAKRAAMLELGLHKLGRQADCRVMRGRVERGRWRGEGSLGDSFDVAGARAVFGPKQWWDEGRRWVRAGGVVILHLAAGADVPAGEVAGRLDGERWSIVGLRPG